MTFSTDTVQRVRDDLEYRPPFDSVKPEDFNIEDVILAGAIIKEIDDGRPSNPAEFQGIAERINPDKYPFQFPAFDNATFDLRDIKYSFPIVPPKFIDENGDLDRTRITIQQTRITSRTIINGGATPTKEVIEQSFTAEEQRAYTQKYGWKVGAKVGLNGKIAVPKIGGTFGGDVGLDFTYSSEITDNKAEKTSRTEKYSKTFDVPPGKTYRIIAISETGHFQTKFEPVKIQGNIKVTRNTAERWRDGWHRLAEQLTSGVLIPSHESTLATNITKNYTTGDIAFNIDRHNRLDLTLQKFRPQADWLLGPNHLLVYGPGRGTEYYDNPNLRLRVSTNEGFKMSAALGLTAGIRSRKVLDTWAGSLKYDGMADGRLESPLAYFDSGLHVKIISFSNVDERIIDLQNGILGDGGFFVLPDVELDVLEDGTEVILGMEGTPEDDLMRGDQGEIDDAKGTLRARTSWQEALQGIDVVIHMAARAHILEESVTNPVAEFDRINAEGTINLVKQCLKVGVKHFIFLSSIGAVTTLSDTIINESSPCNPDFIYFLLPKKLTIKGEISPEKCS